MSTAQRIKVIGILILLASINAITVAGAIGLIRLPGGIAAAVGWAVEFIQWARLGLAIVLAVWVMLHREAEAYQQITGRGEYAAGLPGRARSSRSSSGS
jgi:hypothetical protein